MPVTLVKCQVCKRNQEHAFYSLPEFEEWKKEQNNLKGWETKYYKGALHKFHAMFSFCMYCLTILLYMYVLSALD